MQRSLLLCAAALVGLSLIVSACGSDSTPSSLQGAAASVYGADCAKQTNEVITIYSGRSEDLVQPVLDAFECATGIATATNFGDPTDLALSLTEEGDRTPADVFLSKSPGAVGFLRAEGLLSPLNNDLTSLVDPANVAADRTWVGITGRQRVLVYNIDSVDATDLPSSVFELTKEKYRGRVGIPATNGSFQDWFTVFRAQQGDDVASEWLEAMVDNDAIKTESNRPTVDAVGRGEFDFGLVNHYYNFQEAKALGDDHRAANHAFASDDIGSLVIVTAAGITTSSDNVTESEALIEFLLSDGAQTFFTNDTLEYPLAAGVKPAAVLPDLNDAGADFDVDFDSLGNGLQRTVEIIDESGING